MSYYLSKSLPGPFDAVVGRVIQALAARGFGVLTTIDVRDTLKRKLGVDFKPYTILGACNPHYAYRALQAEDRIGTMLPCNVTVMEKAPGEIEVCAIDPVASMASVGNPELADIASKVRGLLKEIVDGL